MLAHVGVSLGVSDLARFQPLDLSQVAGGMWHSVKIGPEYRCDTLPHVHLGKMVAPHKSPSTAACNARTRSHDVLGMFTRAWLRVHGIWGHLDVCGILFSQGQSRPPRQCGSTISVSRCPTYKAPMIVT